MSICSEIVDGEQGLAGGERVQARLWLASQESEPRRAYGLGYGRDQTYLVLGTGIVDQDCKSHATV
jgi:hypothetical protein